MFQRSSPYISMNAADGCTENSKSERNGKKSFGCDSEKVQENKCLTVLPCLSRKGVWSVGPFN